MKRLLLLAALCVGSNAVWFNAYSHMDRDYMHEEGLRNEADYLLGKGGYYRVERVSDGQVRVVCQNGGDSTVRPEATFGQIVIDCGTK